MAKGVYDRGLAKQPGKRQPDPEMLARHRRVRELHAQGLTNQVIALRLGYAPMTVWKILWRAKA